MSGTLGRTFAEARRRRGKSLMEAERATCIRAHILAALEAGEHDSLPGAAYVRGYIKSYAGFLEIDPQPLLEMYDRERKGQPREAIRLPDTILRPRAHLNTFPMRTALRSLAVIAVLVTVVWVFTRFVMPADPVLPLPHSSDEVPATAIHEQSVLHVAITQSGGSWLRVRIDGLIAYEGTLLGGESREWTFSEYATLQVGAPTNVTITRDGEHVTIPHGESPTVTLTAGRDPTQ